MKTTKGELRLLEGLVLFALAMAVIGTVLSIPGPFQLGGSSGRLITRSGERLEVSIPERCNLEPTTGTSQGNVGFRGVCTAEAEVGGPVDWTAPLHQPAFAAARIGTGLLVTAVLYLLLRIVRTLGAGDPFVPANARRLTIMGFLTAVGGLLVQAARTIGETNALDRIERLAPGLVSTTREFELSFAPAAAGLLLIGLAEVFRQGTRLREDVEGLV